MNSSGDVDPEYDGLGEPKLFYFKQRKKYGYVHFPPRFGVIQFSSATYTASDSDLEKIITVTRTGGADGKVTVHYATSNGSATAGLDYTAVSGTLTWEDGDAEPKTFAVPIIPDAATESSETVNLTLSAPGRGAALGDPATAVLTITDVPVPVIQFVPTAITIPTPASFVGDVPMSLEVTRTGSLAAVSVDWISTSGASGTLHFAAGDATSRLINLDVFTETEDWRIFTVTLSNPVSVPAYPSPIIAEPLATVTVTRAIYTSQPYPIVVIEAMNTAMPVDGGILYNETLEGFDVASALTGGELRSILRTYGMLPEAMDLAQGAISGGELHTILRSYAMLPEAIDIAQASLTGGTLKAILVTNAMKPEAIDIGQGAITGGTLA